jgi:hypothetical protein
VLIPVVCFTFVVVGVVFLVGYLIRVRVRGGRGGRGVFRGGGPVGIFDALRFLSSVLYLGGMVIAGVLVGTAWAVSCRAYGFGVSSGGVFFRMASFFR